MLDFTKMWYINSFARLCNIAKRRNIMYFTEDTYEHAVLEVLSNMGYMHVYAPTMDRADYSSPLLDAELCNSLVRINKQLPFEAIQEAILKLKNFVQIKR